MADDLAAFCHAVLRAVGADEATADAATRAMMHGSRLGVDSHGVRLLEHYAGVLEAGRVARAPYVTIVRELGAVATLDAGFGHGALAGYRAMEKAISIASTYGIGAVGIRNMSHFGPAGAYAVEAAKAGLIGFATCNSDSLVRLHDGAALFHGTNPLAWSAPVKGQRPWLLDMATSAVPFNRVLLYRSLGLAMPADTASDEAGAATTDPHATAMLAPLGAAFGFKGAGLAGVAEVFSAVLTGMQLSTELLPMSSQDKTTPRALGGYMMAINPDAFVDRPVFDDTMTRYLANLRSSPARPGTIVMAPGDREWAEWDRREVAGIPIDPDTEAAFARFAEAHGLDPLPIRPAG
ncbi:Ldh family oxidoreductase [Acuticoccus mangrovi]|uniref:Ldh family oxidoreductase n=1 Tax=Acuticoccus mangrovi TaxID=2796142 RepID=A0A934IKD6_9HYPH|nr:Ldh family oxidoreductase [Acuticoccus mangrovi]MBJ3775397.1 Ldh family oxidoreductase [Acuticoccus mangrovi]